MLAGPFQQLSVVTIADALLLESPGELESNGCCGLVALVVNQSPVRASVFVRSCARLLDAMQCNAHVHCILLTFTNIALYEKRRYVSDTLPLLHSVKLLSQ